MAVFNVMSKSSEFVDMVDQIALANGGFAFVTHTSDFIDSQVVEKAFAIIYEPNAKGELVRKAEVDIGTMLPGAKSADTLTIRETFAGNLMVMHDSFPTDTATQLKGHLMSHKGVGIGDLVTLSADEFSYQFFDGDYDVDPRLSEQVVLLTRQDPDTFDFFYDLMLFDDTGAEPKLTRIKTIHEPFFSTFLGFDDGSLYGGTPSGSSFTTTLLHASESGTPNWELPKPERPDQVFAVGNRVAMLSFSGGALHQTERLDVFERGFGDVAVETAKLSHAGEGAAGGAVENSVVEIHGVGFAALHYVSTENSNRGFVDIFDLDGDFLKSFQLGGAFSTAKIQDVRPLALDSSDAIEIVVSGTRFGNVGDLQSLLATTVTLTTALDLDGTAQSDDMFGLSRNDVLRGFEGDDLMRGNDGNDTIDGGEGNDLIESGAGDDKVLAGEGKDFIISTGGNDDIFGNAGSDGIEAGGGDILVRGGDGNDQIVTEEGRDDIKGGEGNDDLASGKGDDKIAGDAGDDVISAGSGNDKIFSGEGGDLLRGGNGKDIFAIHKAATDGIVIEDFNHGEDKIELTGFAGLTSFKKLKIFDLGGSMEVLLGKDEDSPALDLKGLDSLQASDFIF